MNNALDLTIKNYASIDSRVNEFDQLVWIEKQLQAESAWTKETLLEILSSKFNHLLLVLQGTKVVAYCVYQVLFENAEILRIGTHPDYQRQGLANQMLDKLLIIFQTQLVEKLLLEVRADNLPAIALYSNHGFVQIDRRKSYYQQKNQPSVDALILQKQLTVKLGND